MKVVGALSLAMLLAAACTATSGTSTPSPGRGRESSIAVLGGAGVAPVVVGGERTCPAPAPVPARRAFFYPAFYPQDEVPPADRCFITVAQARGAGLRLAPPPRGDVVMGGVYLVPAGPAFVPLCRRAARQLGFPVACPETVPSPLNGVERVTTAPDFLLEENFAAPPSYRGAGLTGRGPGAVSRGHLWIESTNQPLTAGSICGVGPPAPVPTATPTTVRGGPAHLVSCSRGSSTHSGHVVLFWHEAGSWHLVSLHGHTAVNRRIDALIARSVRIVGP